MEILSLFVLLAIAFFVMKKAITLTFLSFFEEDEITAVEKKAEIYKRIKI